MALPYFLSAWAYIYEHLISRALTSFSPPAAPPRARSHSWFLLALPGRPRPRHLGGDAGRAGADAEINLQALGGELSALAGSRDGAAR